MLDYKTSFELYSSTEIISNFMRVRIVYIKTVWNYNKNSMIAAPVVRLLSPIFSRDSHRNKVASYWLKNPAAATTSWFQYNENQITTNTKTVLSDRLNLHVSNKPIMKMKFNMNLCVRRKQLKANKHYGLAKAKKNFIFSQSDAFR